jgi:hypothetical protein
MDGDVKIISGGQTGVDERLGQTRQDLVDIGIMRITNHE